ncbi:MAG: hypothetical protein KIT16_12540, partial [Rhodospirillaceae bacterium]|nr:hypothetical protein [Rhodospirillaceae bacterium]
MSAALPYSRGRRAGLGLVVPLLVLAAWESSARLGTAPDWLVAPSVVLATTWEMIASGEMWHHAGDSLFRTLAGYAIGGFFGVGMGLLAGVVRPVERFYDPIVSLTYP